MQRNCSPYDSATLHSASERWEKFAQLDPYTYILTEQQGAGAAEFWKSGEQVVSTELLPLLSEYALRPLVALEIGCGLGRLAIPLTKHFQQVAGVDVSPTMVQQATVLTRERGISNAFYTAIARPEDLLDLHGYVRKCDLVYSILVFQHIADFQTIAAYLRAIGALLSEHGIAYLQFDTRPQTAAYRLKTQCPDFLLPRFWRRGIRRIRRSPSDIAPAIRAAGLAIACELTPRTAYHRYILRPAASVVESQ